MRKLASIQRITALEPIEGADKIELASILGWKVITQKNIHKVGDLVVFHEVDTFLPVQERYEFLRSKGFKSTTNLGDGFRLRSMKMRKQLSQGLILPLAEFMDELEGIDLSEPIGVQAFEKPIPAHLAGRVRGNFPMWIRKSDQERAQNLGKELRQAFEARTKFEVTMKLDGSSMTVYSVADISKYQAAEKEPKNTPRTGVCSRNLDLDETEDNAFWRCAQKLYSKNLITAVNRARILCGFDLAFQGELMGPGVQGNREQFIDLEFFLYNIWNIDEQRYLLPDERLRVMAALSNDGIDVSHIPDIDTVSLDQIASADSIVDDLLKYADRPSMTPEIPCEGLVFKAVDNTFQFKVINNAYLLAEKD